jgi:hypothetical protein
MRTIQQAAIGITGLLGLTVAAWAADMTGAEIKELVSGKSVYMETGTGTNGGAGQGIIYYGADGNALYKTAKGTILHGAWSIQGDTLCNDWKEVPNNACSKYDKQGTTITTVNAKTGQPRGKIQKIVSGNSEKIGQ